MTIRMPEWIRRLTQPAVTPEDTGDRIDAIPDNDVDQLATKVWNRLTQCNTEDAQGDPQGYLFALTLQVSDTMPRAEHSAITPAQKEVLYGQLRTAVAQLPPRQRQALMMHVGHGFTYKQIAQRLECSNPVALRELRLAYSTVLAVTGHY